MAPDTNKNPNPERADYVDHDDLMSTPRAAKELKVSESMLNKMRCTGDGPPFYKIGSRVFYSRRDNREWLRSRRRTSTSNHHAA